MEFEYRSEWLVNHVELLKAIHGYEKDQVNAEIGSVDYVANGDGDEKRLLRVIIGPKRKKSKVFTDIIRKTSDFLESENYDEALILAEEVSQGAKNLIRENEKLRYISSSIKQPYPLYELVYAIQKKTGELCKLRCGKIPETEEDCKGYLDGEYTCSVRRVSDDADFHTDRRWPHLLINDFSKLVTIESE